MKPARQDTLAAVCELVSADRLDDARNTIRRDYPFMPVVPSERRYGEVESLRVFMRDGFIDRYSGERLVFPGTLRLLALRMPDAFPYHPNWKMSETHLAFWELSPTVDHIVPVSRGGRDEEDNWATTSMLRNSAKANWTLEELGWTLHPPDRSSEWDGLLGWFHKFVRMHPEVLTEPRIRAWRRAVTACLPDHGATA